MVIKKVLRNVFELRFLPNVSLFLFNSETWLRLFSLRKLLWIIDPHKNKRIIDIGGGTGRLELMLDRKDIYIYDTNKEAISIARHNFENALIGDGSMIEFDNNYFDWAISMHTLEHIPCENRENFILQMIRISKEGVFLNFPEGEHATKLCVNFLDSLEKNGKDPNKWTLEHLKMGVPQVDEISEILKKQDKFIFKYIFVRNYVDENHYWTNIRASKSIIKAYILSPINSLFKFINYKKSPTVELLLIGSKSESRTDELISNM